MIKFYTENQKMIHKLIVNQIAISALGLMVGFPVNALAFNMGLGEIPLLLAGLFTAAMYFFVLYDAFWEWGTKYVSGKGEKVPTTATAFKVAAFGYIPTFLLVLVYAVCVIFKLGALNVFKMILLFVCNGMHFSTMNFIGAYIPKNYIDIVHLMAFIVFAFAAIGICALGFSVGKKGKTMFAGYFHKKPNQNNN